METEITIAQMRQVYHGNMRNYLIGFIGSLLLTLTSFGLAASQLFERDYLIVVIAGLAFGQFILQMLFFLNIGSEGKPHWETIVFFFMLLILFIVVAGTLWIMSDLHGRTMNHQHKEMVYD